ncbi:MAG: hypothetical protein C4538_07005 [Nitrospiraceae bacterium]|nr:MAG: hypothetical protein C4538_07005 [Nitrospiraceae bacterium]
MNNAVRAIKIFSGIFVFLVMIFTGTPVLASEEPESSTDFDLVIRDGFISLNARDASLKKIAEEIGRRMGIKVDVHIAEDEKITEQFDRLPLEEALKRVSANYAYLLNSEKEKGKIIRIVLLKKGHEGKVAASRPDQKKQPQEPFKFEFDPR